MAEKFLILLVATLLLLLIITPIFSHENHIKFDHLTVADGLSSDGVLAVWQDSRGFMWFGTLDGLNRYDGYTFKVYRYNPQDSCTISSNVCWYLYTDRSGDLWVGTFAGGLNKFNYTNESFTRYRHDPDNPHSIGEDWINRVYEDRSGVFWVGTETAGLNKFDGEIDSFSHYCPDPNAPNTRGAEFVIEIYEPSQKNENIFWLGTRQGITLFDRQTGTFTPMKTDPMSGEAMTFQKVTNIYEDNSGILWIGTRGDGLIKYDPQKGKLAHYRHNPKDPNSLSNDLIQPDGIRADPDNPADFLWIPTRGGGINKFEKKNGKFIRYRSDENDHGSLSGNSIWGLYFDNIGTMWVGTVRDGVNKFSRLKEKFYLLHLHHNFPEDVKLKGVSTIFKSRSGTFWLGTLGYGLYRWDSRTGHVTQYKHDSRDVNSISSNSVWGIDEDSRGYLWIATNVGLNKLNPTTNHFTHYKCDPEDPYHNIRDDLRDVLIDSEDILWVASWDGLCKFDRISEKIIRYKYRPEDPQSISNNRIWGIFEDSNRTLWICTEGGGLNKFDRASETFNHFRHDPANPYSISNDRIYGICEVNDSTGSYFWLATGDGLNKMDIATERFLSYGLSEGLPATHLESLGVDNNGAVWVQTYSGISRFDPQTETFRNFDVNDGIPTPLGNPMVCFTCDNGELFFGARHGLICIHPDSIMDNPHIPPIYLTDFKVLNQAYVMDSCITDIKRINLPHSQNFFSFEFAALDFVAPTKNQYAYKLEGLDQDWIYCGNRHFANYTDVDPGEYVFRVKGSNNDGLWNEQGASVRIIIHPPWWQTGWAYTFYISIFLFVIYALRRSDLKRQQLKAQLQLEHQHAEKCEELEHLKSRFFANISHEFRTPLTLILGPLKQWITKIIDLDLKQDLKLIQRNAERLLYLINQLLDLSKLETRKMKLQVHLTDITDFLKLLVLSFASLAERKRISLKFKPPAETIMAYIDREMVEKIVTNLLSNAFKFTPEGGKVIVDFGLRNAELKDNSKIQIPNSKILMIYISNSGPGISPDKLPHIFDRFYQADDSYTRNQDGTGIGLALSKELVELHHGKITVESEEGKGSTFTVWLPVGKKHLMAEEIEEEGKQETADRRPQTGDGRLVIGLPTANRELPTDQTNKIKKTRYKTQDTRKEKTTVLIVEDHPDMRRYIRGYLEQTYRILEAKDGEEGFIKSTKVLPDLIVSDVMMPKMDGFALCEKLKTDEHTSHIPVILLTARADAESKLEGLETGADDYLTKPFDAKELQVRVKNLIEQRRKLRERFSRQAGIQPKDITVTSMDEQFLQRAMDILEQHISDARFSIEDFSYEIGFSQRHLNRKLQALTNLPARDFIRTLRLQRARQLLQQKSATILEIAYEVGFNNPSHFSKCFKKQFGESPREFVAGKG